MEKNIQTVRLDSDKGNLLLLNSGKLSYDVQGWTTEELIKASMANAGIKPQHLYFLSDDNIKEGDKVFDLHRKVILGCPDEENASFYRLSKHRYKKIIASTDESLELPELSKEWIRYYVFQHNIDNTITEVKVEYDKVNEPVVIIGKFGKKYRTLDNFIRRPKVNPDNTINIKTEETWDNILEAFRKSPLDNYDKATIGNYMDKLKYFLKANYEVPKKK